MRNPFAPNRLQSVYPGVSGKALLTLNFGICRRYHGSRARTGQIQSSHMKRNYPNQTRISAYPLTPIERNAFQALLIKAEKTTRAFDCTKHNMQLLLDACQQMEDFARPHVRPGQPLEDVLEDFAQQVSPSRRPPLTISDMIDDGLEYFIGSHSEPSYLNGLINQYEEAGAVVRRLNYSWVDAPQTPATGYTPKFKLALVHLFKEDVYADDLTFYTLIPSRLRNPDQRQDAYIGIDIPALNSQICVNERNDTPTYVCTALRQPQLWADQSPKALGMRSDMHIIPADTPLSNWTSKLSAALNDYSVHPAPSPALSRLLVSSGLYFTPAQHLANIIDYIKNNDMRFPSRETDEGKAWLEKSNTFMDKTGITSRQLFEGSLLNACINHQKAAGAPATPTSGLIPGLDGLTWADANLYLTRKHRQSHDIQAPLLTLASFQQHPTPKLMAVAEQITPAFMQTHYYIHGSMNKNNLLQIGLYYLANYDVLPIGPTYRGPLGERTFWQNAQAALTSTDCSTPKELYEQAIAAKKVQFLHKHKRPVEPTDGHVDGWPGITWKMLDRDLQLRTSYKSRSSIEEITTDYAVHELNSVLFRSGMFTSIERYATHQLRRLQQNGWNRDLPPIQKEKRAIDDCMHAVERLSGRTLREMFTSRVRYCAEKFKMANGRPATADDGMIEDWPALTWGELPAAYNALRRVNDVKLDLNDLQTLQLEVPDLTDKEWRKPLFLTSAINDAGVDLLWQHHLLQHGVFPSHNTGDIGPDGNPKFWLQIHMHYRHHKGSTLRARIENSCTLKIDEFSLKHQRKPVETDGYVSGWPDISWKMVLGNLRGRQFIQVNDATDVPVKLQPQSLDEIDAAILVSLQKGKLPAKRSQRLSEPQRREWTRIDAVLQRRHGTTLLKRTFSLIGNKMSMASPESWAAEGLIPDCGHLKWQQLDEMLRTQLTSHYTTLDELAKGCGLPPIPNQAVPPKVAQPTTKNQPVKDEIDQLILGNLDKGLWPSAGNQIIPQEDRALLNRADYFLTTHHQTSLLQYTQALLQIRAQSYPDADGPCQQRPTLSWQKIDEIASSQTRNRAATDLFKILNLNGPPRPNKSQTAEYTKQRRFDYYHRQKANKKPGPG